VLLLFYNHENSDAAGQSSFSVNIYLWHRRRPSDLFEGIQDSACARNTRHGSESEEGAEQLEAKHFSAVTKLMQALGKRDRLAAKKAMAELSETYCQLAILRKTERGEAIGASRKHLGPQATQDISEYFRGLSPEECLEVFEGLRLGPMARQDPHWMLSFAISEELQDVRGVLWWADNRFTPAFWCKNLRTAFYVRVLLSTVGGKGFRICPSCVEPFLQVRSDQDYCCTAHQAAHRMARWRAQQKAAKETHGTRKKRRLKKKTSSGRPWRAS